MRRARRRDRRFVCEKQIVLGDGFEVVEKIPAGRRDLPAVMLADDIALAKNVDRRHAACKPADARAPFHAAGGEDGDVPIERGERRPAAAVTGQYF